MFYKPWNTCILAKIFFCVWFFVSYLKLHIHHSIKVLLYLTCKWMRVTFFFFLLFKTLSYISFKQEFSKTYEWTCVRKYLCDTDLSHLSKQWHFQEHFFQFTTICLLTGTAHPWVMWLQRKVTLHLRYQDEWIYVSVTSTRTQTAW